MVSGVQDDEMTPGRFGNFRLYLRQRPVMLGLLTGVAVLFFLTVTGLSSVYHAQREALGDRWFNRGVADLDAKRYEPAVTEFRAALLYSRDNYAYQLNLAEALIGINQTGQAYAYLLNLWDREPENGQANLELARIVAARGQAQQATRYYHDAVYATWPTNEESRRREARLELIDLLLRTNAQAQAQAELIALSENEAEEPALQDRLGDLFMRAGDYERALAAYRLTHALPADNWTLLHGEPDDVLELAALLGLKFKEDANGQFAHSNVITILNAQGEIVHQEIGLNQDINETVRILRQLAAK